MPHRRAWHSHRAVYSEDPGAPVGVGKALFTSSFPTWDQVTRECAGTLSCGVEVV